MPQTLGKKPTQGPRRQPRRCTLHRDLRAAESPDERQGRTRGDSRDPEPGRFLRRDGTDRSGTAIGERGDHRTVRAPYDYANGFHEVFAEELRPYPERDPRPREAPARRGQEDRKPGAYGRLRTRRAASDGNGRDRRRPESGNQEAAQAADREDGRSVARNGEPRHERAGNERAHRGSRASNPASRFTRAHELARR